MKKTSKFLLLITAAVLLPTVSWADIMFIPGNNPQPDEENVLLNQGETGNVVTGSTNQSHTPVNFTSTQTLTIPANGQARIEATSGGSQEALNNITFSLASGTFTDAIFNMHIGGTIGDPDFNAEILVVNNVGNASSILFPLGNGENFLTVVASNGQSIESISIAYPPGVGFTDLRQVRISGAGPTVPDSGSTLCLLFLSLIGLFGLNRLRHVQLA